jgi:phosphopantothenoylcysteine decarboxylase/phosphopantothenate--cysteine ligase
MGRFTTVGELRGLLDSHFHWCDVLLMTAAVGDFRFDGPADRKLSRKAGPVNVRLVPTEDVVAAAAARKRGDQTVVTFAVEDLPLEKAMAKARAELRAKNADWVVLNRPAAMGSDAGEACVLTAEAEMLGWARREKSVLAREIIRLLECR